MTAVNSEQVVRFRVRLEAELAEIERALTENAAWAAPVELDQQSVGRVSRIDALQMQAIAVANRQRQTARRAKIRAALKRVDDGEFGKCTECGEEIVFGRLDIDPASPTCINCAA